MRRLAGIGGRPSSTAASLLFRAAPSARRGPPRPGRRRLASRSAGTWRWSAPLLLVALAFAPIGRAAPPDEEANRTSYSLGHQIGMDLVRQQRQVDLDAVRRGLGDGLAGADPAYPADELTALLVELKRGIVASERTDRLVGASIRRSGDAFLAENGRRPDVTQRPSGLQYRVVRPGAGARPRLEDTVELRYRSTRLDGVAFHDSMAPDQRPERLRVGALLPGLREALPLMPVGARWEIVLPPSLAFGRRGPLAHHTVIYDLELIAIVPDRPEDGGAGP